MTTARVQDPEAEASATRPLLEIDDVRVFFKVRAGVVRRTTHWVHAVDGVSLRLHPRETLALVGESGCGKTTLGRTIVGLQEPTSGEVRYADGSGNDRRLGHAQMVFQDPFGSLDPRQRVKEIVAEPLVVKGLGKTKDRRVVELLRLVGLPTDATGRYPHEFSGGQRQRIGIARAIAGATPVVVCDEPTSALDVSIQAQIITLLRRLQDQLGVSLIYISHDLAAVRNIAHRVAVMYFGKVVELGEVAQIYGAPRHPYTKALLSAVPGVEAPSRRILLSGDPPSPTDPPGGCRFQDRCWLRARLGNPEECVTIEPTVGTDSGAACHFTDELENQARQLFSSQEAVGGVDGPSSPFLSTITDVAPKADPDRVPLLKIEDLRVELPVPGGTLKAVRGLSLELPVGGSIGLVGESGSGKTMSVLSLLRLAPPTARISAKTMEFDGTDLLQISDRALRTIRGRRVGVVFQDPLSALNPLMSVGDQIAETVQLHLKLSRKAARKRAADLLGWVGVPQPNRTLDRYPHQLSGGMRQRCLIAIALSCDPALLIADEPTTAVDVTVQAQIIDVLRRIRRETGMGLLLITHDLGVAAELVDRLETMYAGEIVEEGPVRRVIGNPRHPYSMALLRSRPTLQARELNPIGGAPPDLSRPITGCPFAPRCTYAIDACKVDPRLELVEPDHRVACWVRPTPEPDARLN